MGETSHTMVLNAEARGSGEVTWIGEKKGKIKKTHCAGVYRIVFIQRNGKCSTCVMVNQIEASQMTHLDVYYIQITLSQPRK